MPVNTPCAEYQEALPDWEQLRDCIKGRRAMEKAGEKYIPKLGAESANNDAYLKRAHFYNATDRTQEGLVGAVFQKAPQQEIPPSLEPVVEDITPRGKTSLPVFAKRVFEEVVAVGRVGLLVEMPADGGADGDRHRPYVVLWKAEDIISWRTMKRGADEVLSHVVLEVRGQRQDEEDPWIMQPETTYLVLELGQSGEVMEGNDSGGPIYTQTMWREKRVKVPDGFGGETEAIEWVPDPTVVPLRRGIPLDFIPFMIIGPNGISPDIAKAPLLDLSEVNVAHWRNSADYEHGLHLTSLPTPVVIGADTTAPVVELGSGAALNLPQGGEAMYLEFSGAGMAELRNAMDAKKGEMAALGARLLEEQRGGAETATAAMMRHTGENANLADMAISAGAALSDMLRWMAWWVGVEERPADVKAKIELNTDFQTMRMTTAQVKDLVFAMQSDAISYPWFYYLLERGGMTRPGISIEEEIETLKREGRTPYSSPPEPGDEGLEDEGDPDKLAEAARQALEKGRI